MRVSMIFLPLVALTVAACNDNLGPTSWDPTPDTVTLYSASRPALAGEPSGFDFTVPTTVLVEAANVAQNFDVVLIDQNGSFAFLPSGAMLGQSNRAGIATVEADSLGAIRQAPTDTAQYQQGAAVPLEPGSMVVVRSRRAACLLTTGSYYAKLQVLSMDATAGTLTFAYVRNPYCGDQSLVPPGS